MVYLFYIQGDFLSAASRVGGSGSRLGWSRFTSLGSSVGKRVPSGDPQLELLHELTSALEDATEELQQSDKEVRSLRLKLERQGRQQRSLGGSSSSEGPPPAAHAASSASSARAAGAPAAAAAAAPGEAPSDPELEDALSSLAFFPLPPAATLLPALPCQACLRHGSGLEQRLCLPAPCPLTPPRAARIISTSLYGDNPRYTWGTVRNAELMPTVFPGWRLRVYTRSDMLPPQDILTALRALGAEVVELSGEDRSSGFGMNWRFLVADDPEVEAFLCRDGDSRVSLRDRWAAEAWLGSAGREPFHIVRDHPSHAGYKLMGGTWGARAATFGSASLQSMRSILGGWVASRGHGDYGSDIDFLSVSVVCVCVCVL